MLFNTPFLPLCLLCFGGSTLSFAQPTVTIASGIIVGTATRVPSATAAVNQFLGIPFAVSPPERFSPPVSPKKWHTPLRATQRKPSCVQQFNYPEASRNFTIAAFNTPSPPESEDCLYLNVFSPATVSPRGGRSVMFWLYGGGLQFGYGGIPSYDGSSLAANQDVIVVTSNYRMNVFGFPNAPEQKQNLGFLDQRKALDWVQKNIAAFGGDPRKVTIFGESAGGYSVKQLLAFPPSPLNFRAAIIESSGPGLTGDGTLAWRALVAGLNCSAAVTQFDCVKQASATDIKSIVEHGALNFVPVPDNVTHSPSMSAAITSRKAAPVPILIGSNKDEGSLSSLGVIDYDAWLQSNFPGQPALQAALSTAYPLSVYGTAARAASAIFTDFAVSCPASAFADLAKNHGFSVYRYRFDAAFPNLQLFPDAGAFHSCEILEVFGTFPRENATAQQSALSNYMQTVWARFAKNPSAGPGWPKLGTALEHGGEVVEQATIDKNCAIFEPLIVV